MQEGGRRNGGGEDDSGSNGGGRGRGGGLDGGRVDDDVVGENNNGGGDGREGHDRGDDEGDPGGGGDDDGGCGGGGCGGGSPLTSEPPPPSSFLQLLLPPLNPLLFPPQPPSADDRDEEEDFERGVDDQGGNENSGNFFPFFLVLNLHIASCDDSFQLVVWIGTSVVLMGVVLTLKNEASLLFILRVNSQQWLPCNGVASCMGVGETPLLVKGHQNLEKFLHSGLIVCFWRLHHLSPIIGNCPRRLWNSCNQSEYWIAALLKIPPLLTFLVQNTNNSLKCAFDYTYPGVSCTTEWSGFQKREDRTCHSRFLVSTTQILHTLRAIICHL